MECNAPDRIRTKGPTSGKSGGIVGYALVLLVALALIGAGFYFFRQSQQADYSAETARLARSVSSAVRQLGAHSTLPELARIRSDMDQYFKRSDADAGARSSWQPALDEWEAKLSERTRRLADLQERVEAFRLDATVAEMEVLDAEIAAATQGAGAGAGEELRRAWTPVKKQFLAAVNSVSATILARSIPSGAKTYLNGEYIGLSSLGIQNVRRGEHVIRFEKEGYAPAEQTVTVAQSGQLDPGAVELSLLASPVRVVVSGGKSRAKVTVSLEKAADGNEDVLLFIEEREGRDVQFAAAPVGSLRAMVIVDGRMAIDRVIENKGDGETRIELALE